MNSPAIDINQLDGLLFAEAVDRLYRSEAERQVARLVDHWGENAPKAVHLLAHLNPAYWSRFASAKSQPLVDRQNDPLVVTYAIGPEMRDYLALARLKWFENAVEPLLAALRSGDVSATGIREPGNIHGWQRQPIPVGLFEVGRWELCRDGSRLIELDQCGKETGTAFSAAKIHRSLDAGAKFNRSDPTNAEAAGRAPARVIHNHTGIATEAQLAPSSTAEDTLSSGTSHPSEPLGDRTGFPGRPSLNNLILCELERRASTDEMRETPAAEGRTLAEWAAATYPKSPYLPTPRTVENQIRTKFRELNQIRTKLRELARTK
jgi:hypothetical protein